MSPKHAKGLDLGRPRRLPDRVGQCARATVIDIVAMSRAISSQMLSALTPLRVGRWPARAAWPNATCVPTESQRFQRQPIPVRTRSIGGCESGSASSAVSLSCIRAYRAGPVTGTATEVFPKRPPFSSLDDSGERAKARSNFAGPNCGEWRNGAVLETVDAVDAGIAALTGLLALEGAFSAIGEPEEE